MSEEGRTRTVFIADSDTGLLKAMEALLRSHGFAVTEWPFTEPAARLAASRKIDICVLGSSPPGSADALDVAAQIRRSNRAIPIILIAGDGSEERAISAIRAGVNDYLRCADALKGLLASIERCSRDLGEAAPDLGSCDAMIGQSEQIRKVKAHLLQIAATDTTVLITGSTG